MCSTSWSMAAVTKTYTYGLQWITENQLSGSTWTPTFYGYDGHGKARFPGEHGPAQ
jgi:hypothetical protein